MNTCFVNLPIRYIAGDESYLNYFLARGIKPELGLDAVALDELDLEWHKWLSNTLKQADLSCSIHLPFHDLQPGSMDTLILQATRDRLQQAMQIARVYEPKFLIAHANFIPLYNDMFAKWLLRAVNTWKSVLKVWPEHPPLYLENVREYEPGPLADLFAELTEFKVKFCLDIGHWSSYGGGGRYQNLSIWIQSLGPYLAHMHLHDNDGVADQHLGLGLGKIPWVELFAGLEFLELTPGFTLEPHTKEDLEQCWWFIKKHPTWFARLGVRKNHSLSRVGNN